MIRAPLTGNQNQLTLTPPLPRLPEGEEEEEVEEEKEMMEEEEDPQIRWL